MERIDPQKIKAWVAEIQAHINSSHPPALLTHRNFEHGVNCWRCREQGMLDTITALLEELQWRQLCPQKLVDAERALEHVRGDRRDLTARVAALTAERDALKGKSDTLAKGVSNLTEVCDRSDEELNNLTARVTALEGERERLRQLVDKYNANHGDIGPCMCSICHEAHRALRTTAPKDGAS